MNNHAVYTINGYFRVTNAMNVVGIGYILTGNITRGQIEPGNIIQVETKQNSAEYLIEAVEIIEYSNGSDKETALILAPAANLVSVDILYELVGQLIPISGTN